MPNNSMISVSLPFKYNYISSCACVILDGCVNTVYCGTVAAGLLKRTSKLCRGR